MLRGVLFLLVFVFTGQPSAARDLIPVEHFARLPDVSQFRISPKGDYGAMIASVRGRRILVVINLDPSKDERPGHAFFEDGELRRVWWATNERVIFGVGFPHRRYGIPIVETRLLSMKRDGKKMKLLIKQRPSPDVHVRQRQAQFRDDVISLLPGDERNVLVAITDSKPFYPDVMSVDVRKGHTNTVQRARFPVSSWIADNSGIVRVGFGVSDKTLNREVKFRLNEKADWQTIHEAHIFDDPDFIPLGYGAEPHILYVASGHEQDTLALYEFDALQRKFIRKIFGHDEFDVSGLAYNPNPLERRVVGVRYYSDEGHVFYFDEEAKMRKALVDKLLPDTSNSIIDESWNGLRRVVLASSDTQPPLYYIVDRRNNLPQLVGQYYPELKSEDMAPMSAVSYTARDGLEIPAFLTIPKDVAAKNLPVVIVPHGGPFSRTIKGFSYWTQFLASRGYAILEPNFRGSRGYGRSFEKSGYKEWGKTMQDDVTDGVQWLIAEGIADPDRICIFGGSYGGYAALMGAVKTPDLYRCAVSVNGVTDLIDLIDHRRRYVHNRVNREITNDPDRDYSPIHNVDKIKIPILLAHGEDDRRVPFDHSKRMAAKLKSAGKAHQFIKLPEGDHFLSRGDNRLMFFKALDSFLAEHLGPGAEPPQIAESLAEAVAE